jgi:hypothetical protein
MQLAQLFLDRLEGSDGAMLFEWEGAEVERRSSNRL